MVSFVHSFPGRVGEYEAHSCYLIPNEYDNFCNFFDAGFLIEPTPVPQKPEYNFFIT